MSRVPDFFQSGYTGGVDFVRPSLPAVLVAIYDTHVVPGYHFFLSGWSRIDNDNSVDSDC